MLHNQLCCCRSGGAIHSHSHTLPSTALNTCPCLCSRGGGLCFQGQLRVSQACVLCASTAACAASPAVVQLRPCCLRCPPQSTPQNRRSPAADMCAAGAGSSRAAGGGVGAPGGSTRTGRASPGQQLAAGGSQARELQSRPYPLSACAHCSDQRKPLLANSRHSSSRAALNLNGTAGVAQRRPRTSCCCS